METPVRTVPIGDRLTMESDCLLGTPCASSTPCTMLMNTPSIISEYELKLDIRRSYAKTRSERPTQCEELISHLIPVSFTVGFLMAAVALLSLEDQSKSGVRLFTALYPFGTILMMSIFLLDLTRQSRQNLNQDWRITSVTIATLLVLSSGVHLSILKLHQIAIGAGLFVCQCTMSFGAAFMRL